MKSKTKTKKKPAKRAAAGVFTKNYHPALDKKRKNKKGTKGAKTKKG